MCHNLRVVEFRRSYLAIFSLSLADNSAADCWHSCSQWSSALVIEPFAHDVDLEVAHVPTKRFCQTIQDERDIIVFAPTAPASSQSHSFWFICMFPLFYHSNGHAVWPTRVSHTCTWFCKFDDPLDQRRSCFGQLSRSLLCCPSTCAALNCFGVPHQTNIPMVIPFIQTIHIILAHAYAIWFDH